ncbi:MAG: hypothetical protein CL927_04490 [Deltaproteobacteria bacterium]|nr:hypothetical protein [Deltaproteobacteria bacterium]
MPAPALRPPPPVRRIGPEPDPGHHTGGLAALWTHRSLVATFVLNDLKQRYTGSSIGFFWTVITPLLELATYTFVFHFVLGLRDGYGNGQAEWASYAIFLFCGMVTWSGIQEGIIRSTTSIADHAHLIKKVNFHAITLPGYVVASAVLNQVIRLGVLLTFILLATRGGMTWHVLLVPPILAAQAGFVLGVGMLLATVSTYFKDTVHIVKAAMLLLMFVTPVFYGPEAYPPRLDLIKQLNPMSHLVGIYRQLLINQELPDSRTFIIIGVIALFSLLVGYSVFHHHQDRFADHV